MATGFPPRFIALADVDGDGDADLLSTTSANSLELFRNDGQGAFGSSVNLAVGADAQNAAFSDIDGDGDVDIVTANGVASSHSIFRNGGTGTFGPRTNLAVGVEPVEIAFADTDGDAELITGNPGTDSISILDNNGAGVFELSEKHRLDTS